MKKAIENGPFQRTDAMLLEPQTSSIPPESEQLSMSQRYRGSDRYKGSGNGKRRTY